MLPTIQPATGAENSGLQKGKRIMNNHYRTFFGFNKEPFGTDISMSEILKTPELVDIKDRFDYVIRLGAIGLVTGEVGSGKSTALRYAMEKLHPSELRWGRYVVCLVMLQVLDILSFKYHKYIWVRLFCDMPDNSFSSHNISHFFRDYFITLR